MRKPIKIVWRHRNSVGASQYYPYIFVGKVEKGVRAVLEKIKDISLEDSMAKLGAKEKKILVANYGDEWYYRFFNVKHVEACFGRAPAIKGGAEARDYRPPRDRVGPVVLVGDQGRIAVPRDIRQDVDHVYRRGSKFVGGGETLWGEVATSDDEEPDADDVFFSERVRGPEGTSGLIEKALDEIGSVGAEPTPFDTSLDSTIETVPLEAVFRKYYVYDEYVLEDDTIGTLKSKFCCNVVANKRFGNDCRVIPSRQHMWCRRKVNGSYTSTMVGQSMSSRSDSVTLDAISGEPRGRIRDYETLKGEAKDVARALEGAAKAQRKDESNYLVDSYDGDASHGEFFLTDVYGELGVGYKPKEEHLRNLRNTYVRLYFPRIGDDEMRDVVDFLSGDPSSEVRKMGSVRESLSAELRMAGEIISAVEGVKINNKIIGEPYVTQGVVYADPPSGGAEVDLYKVFNGFVADEFCPLAQHTHFGGEIVVKYHRETMAKIASSQEGYDAARRWMSATTKGVSLRVKVRDEGSPHRRYASLTLTDGGRFEYKGAWRESAKMLVSDVVLTYQRVRDAAARLGVPPPKDENMRFVFVNTISKVSIPGDAAIDHDDLSEMSRLFYPYVSLVVEPGNRGPRSGRSGTHLRYKRVSGYDNDDDLAKKVAHVLRNYDIGHGKMVSSLARQTNLPESRVVEEIQRAKRSQIDTSGVKRKVSELPRLRIGGVSLDIQGRGAGSYKVKVSGAKSESQISSILDFAERLIGIYIETYVSLLPGRQALRDKLFLLIKVAERASLVNDVVSGERASDDVKTMIKADPRRIGFRPDSGYNQWTRSCQNSGDSKRRRPQQHRGDSISGLTASGYIYDDKNDAYRKKVKVDGEEVTLEALRLPEYDDEGNETGEHVYYTCGPVKNGEHAYVGFLTKSQNPLGHCMPCCFKKDPRESPNERRREVHDSCLSKDKVDLGPKSHLGDLLYVLQATNKIRQNRFGALPPMLDRFFNEACGRVRVTKQNYLESTSEKGHFFKSGVPHSGDKFMSAISVATGFGVDEIKRRVVEATRGDETRFVSIDSGGAKSKFDTIENYRAFIKACPSVPVAYVRDAASLPGCFSDGGVDIIVLRRKETRVTNPLEKDRVKEDFVPDGASVEAALKPTKDGRGMIILVEDDDYQPVVLITKNKGTRKVGKQYIFERSSGDAAIVNMLTLLSLCNESAQDIGLPSSDKSPLRTARALSEAGDVVVGQVVDTRNKCAYLRNGDGVLVPVLPFGCLVGVPIVDASENMASLDTTLATLGRLSKVSPELTVETVVRDDEDVTSVVTSSGSAVPVERTRLTDDISSRYEVVDSPSTSGVDAAISSGVATPSPGVEATKARLLAREAYQMFRLEVSESLSPSSVESVKETLSSNATKASKVKIIRKVILDAALSTIIPVSDPNSRGYSVENKRERCHKKRGKGRCAASSSCTWVGNKCALGVSEGELHEFASRVSSELVEGGVRAMEILREGGYEVPGFVDRDVFSGSKGQGVVRGRSLAHNSSVPDAALADSNAMGGDTRPALPPLAEPPMVERHDTYSQRVAEGCSGVLSAYVNCLHWAKNPNLEPSKRNLGYSGATQESLVRSVRSMVVNHVSKTGVSTPLAKKISKGISTFSTSPEELSVITSLVPDLPILVLDVMGKVVYFSHNGETHGYPDEVPISRKLCANIVVGGNGLLSSTEVDAVYYKPIGVTLGVTKGGAMPSL